MKVNLTLYYSNNLYLVLIKDIDLKCADQITTKYNSQEEIINNSPYTNLIKDFYDRHTYYRRKIKNKKDIDGKIVLTYYNQNNELCILRVLYQQDKIKLEPKKVINGIKKSLKTVFDKNIILHLLNRFNYIFETEYNIH